MFRSFRCTVSKATLRTSEACNFPPPRGLHFGLVQTNQGHALGTPAAEPEVFQRFAAVPRGHGKGINLSVTQVAEFTQAFRIGTLADHQALFLILLTHVHLS